MTPRHHYALVRNGVVIEVVTAPDLESAWIMLTDGRVDYFRRTGWTVTPCEIVLPATEEVQG